MLPCHCLTADLQPAMPYAGINEHVNFRNFLMACTLLLRVATGDNW
jgi:hypothetical protein